MICPLMSIVGSSFCDCMYDQCAWWCGDTAECYIQLLVRVLAIGK